MIIELRDSDAARVRRAPCISDGTDAIAVSPRGSAPPPPAALQLSQLRRTTTAQHALSARLTQPPTYLPSRPRALTQTHSPQPVARPLSHTLTPLSQSPARSHTHTLVADTWPKRHNLFTHNDGTHRCLKPRTHTKADDTAFRSAMRYSNPKRTLELSTPDTALNTHDAEDGGAEQARYTQCVAAAHFG
eukprot:1082674-Pleurochrysis_carterae.AAC.2